MRLKPVVRGRRVLWVLGIIPLTLIIARRNVVRRTTLHADVVVDVGKVVLLDPALAPHANGEDQEQTCDGYSALFSRKSTKSTADSRKTHQ